MTRPYITYPYLATGGVNPRTSPDRFADEINVLDFGTVAEMVVDGTAAFQAAVDSIQVGQAKRVIVPALPSGQSYTLVGTVNDNGRTPFWEFLPGATIVGGASAKFEWPTRRRGYPLVAPGLSTVLVEVADKRGRGQTIAEYLSTTNNDEETHTGAYGRRHDHVSSTFYGTGFDIASAVIATWDRTVDQDDGQMLAQWLVALSPQVVGGTTRHGTFCAEYNAVNRGADTGWTERRGTLNNWSGCLQLVAEASTFTKPGTTYNTTYHLCIGPSSSNKADGIPAQSHAGILIEPNSIAGLTGRGISAAGNNTGTAARDPLTVLDVRQTWKKGIRTREATLVSGLALEMGATQGIGWVDGSDAVVGSLTMSGGNFVLPIANVPNHADDTAASAGGVPVGGIYRTGSALKIRVT